MPTPGRRRPRTTSTKTVLLTTTTTLLLALSSSTASASSSSSSSPAAPADATDIQHYTPRQLREILDFPITYGRYMPPFATEGYEQEYAQAPSQPTWTDPAQQGLNRPGWTKYLYEYYGARAGELNAPILSYGPDDMYAVSAWINQACPSSICRAADRSQVVVDEEGDAKKMAALAQAATMASQPNTGAHLLQYGRDHFSWYYLLARAATQNGSGQLLKIKSDMSAPSYNALRNANGKWSRDTLKANADIKNYPIFAGMRAATDVHMRDRLRAGSQVTNSGLGAVAALSPYPSNTAYLRQRGYRNLQEVQQQQDGGAKWTEAFPAHAAAPAAPAAPAAAAVPTAPVAPPPSTSAPLPVPPPVEAAPPAVFPPGEPTLGFRRRKHDGTLAHPKGRKGKDHEERVKEKWDRKALHEAKHVQRKKRLALKKAARQAKRGQLKGLGIPKQAASIAVPAAALASATGGGEEGAGGEGTAGFAGIGAAATTMASGSGSGGGGDGALKSKKSKKIKTKTAAADKGLLFNTNKKPHMTIEEAMGRIAAGKANHLAPVMAPGPITHPGPLPKAQAFKPIVPAYYHGQTHYDQAPKSYPIVMGDHHPFIHPKVAEHFGARGPVYVDYEHAICNQGFCPGRRRRRRRTQEKEEKLVRKEGETFVYLGQGGGKQVGGPMVEGDKGYMMSHLHHQTPKVTKLIPIDRPMEWQPKQGHTVYKPMHRVYQQPEPSIIVFAPPKKTHPWLQKWGH